MPRHRLLPLAAIAAATLALSACGGTGSGSDPYGTAAASGGAAPAPVDPAAAAPAAPIAGSPMLVAKDASDLGTIITDAEGFTLYRFDKDKAKPTPTTNCVDECATKWPPVTVDPKGKLTLDGVDKSVVGMVQRPDGTSQLTVGGWPVYRFAGDTEPGATAGQGVSGTWFAITPDGKKAAGTGSGAGAAGKTGSAGAAADGSGADGAAGSAGANGSSATSSDGADANGAAAGGGY